MSYFMNPAAFSAVFTVPCGVVDDRIRLATETQLKVLLFALRNLSAGIREEALCQALGYEEKEVRDALDFWVQAGLLNADDTTVTTPPPERKILPKGERPSRRDVAVRGAEDEKVRFLFAEAQGYFGRNLKSNEASTLLWLYDDQGMDLSVLLLLLQYAAGEDRLNITFVERTAVAWIKDGVSTVADAERRIAETVRRSAAWRIVERAFGIEHRQPSEKELLYAERWLTEWQLSAELLKAAYDVCVDAKSKFSMAYTAKILEKWHSAGYRTPADVRTAETTRVTGDTYATYDLAAFEKMLNEKD